MTAPSVAFRLDAARRAQQLVQFNARTEIGWFGFEGAFAEPGEALVTFARIADGARGGGGSAAVNGGVIAAGFDAAFVLAGLGHYDTPVVVTLELAVRFLSLASTSRPLAFHARVVRSSRSFAFVEGELRAGEGEVFASASGMVAPA